MPRLIEWHDQLLAYTSKVTLLVIEQHLKSNDSMVKEINWNTGYQ